MVSMDSAGRFARLAAARSASAAATTQPSPPAGVQIVTTEGCRFCLRTKKALEQYEIPYEELSVAGNPELLLGLMDVTGIKTVPMVFVDGRFVGDSEKTITLLEDNGGDALQSAGRESTRVLPEETLIGLRRSEDKSEGEEIPSSLEALCTRLQQGLQVSPSNPRSVNQEELLNEIQKLERDINPEEVLEQLFQYNLVGQRSSSKAGGILFTRLLPPSRKNEPLNSMFEWTGDASPAIEISKSLQSGMSRLLDRHGSDGGKTIDYKALASDDAFRNIVRLSHQLPKCDLSGLDREERMAFFINIYNVMIVHAMAVLGPPSNFAARLLFYDQVKYMIGGSIYTCNDVENGVLRGNRPSPASVAEMLPFMKAKGPFKEGDPRVSQVVDPPDARIHFALNCGAKSCPAIRVYTADSLEIGLQAAAESFCSDPSNVDVDEKANAIKLSKIFQWYRTDFGTNEELRHLLAESCKSLDESRRATLTRFLSEAEDPELRFVDYDWSLNEPDRM